MVYVYVTQPLVMVYLCDSGHGGYSGQVESRVRTNVWVNGEHGDFDFFSSLHPLLCVTDSVSISITCSSSSLSDIFLRPKLHGYTGCKRTCSVEQAVSCT